MIVGAVRQEDEGSWSDACDAWAALEEHAEAEVHQVRVEEGEPDNDDIGATPLPLVYLPGPAPAVTVANNGRSAYMPTILCGSAGIQRTFR